MTKNFFGGGQLLPTISKGGLTRGDAAVVAAAAVVVVVVGSSFFVVDESLKNDLCQR
jgi:hypothetical protein